MQDDGSRSGLEVAITGMSGRFPGAGGVDEFWQNLKNGLLSTTFFSDEELGRAGVETGVLTSDNYVGARGILEDIENFDAYFFGYSPLEAELLDPQIRLFYEICWEALEDAGCDPAIFPGTIGVYAGATSNRWWQVLAVLSGKSDILGQYTAKYLFDKDFLSSRISYRLNLKGPAVAVQTACSTGLAAVDLACRGLLTAQCDAALAGAVSVLPEMMKRGYIYEEGLIYSPDGYCRAFDARANGTVFADGGGVVFLRRLEDALSDGDSIHVVIKGFGTNNDGIDKSSYTAPSVDGQAAAIEVALYMAEVEPGSVTYVETHGAGTPIGDPIEIEALKTAFNTDRRQYCAIGSVKTNIGHLDTAAGIAGLIKTVLALKHRLIPASLHFQTANPAIDFENSPFYVNAELREWRCNGQPLRAGVSSFGVGGTNVHVILEEVPPPPVSSESRPWQLILLSARTEAALGRVGRNFAGYVKAKPGLNLTDAAYTLMKGRRAFEHRRMLVCSQAKEVVETLSADETPEAKLQSETHEVKGTKRAVLMFPGLGNQYVNMARGLYDREPVFRQEMDRCFELLDNLVDDDIRDILYPPGHPSQELTHPAPSGHPSQEGRHTPPFGHPSQEGINGMEVAQPVIFAVEYALARLLMAWGIEPYAMIGYSFGEYTAACIAGVFSLRDALRLIAVRGELIRRIPVGAMLSVPLPREKLSPLMPADLSLAIDNGPSCIVAGTSEAVALFEGEMKKRHALCMRVPITHAVHSHLMEPVLKAFEREVGHIQLSEPKIPFISNVTGTWMSLKDAVTPGYWAKQLRQSVRFADGLGEVLKDKSSLFIEVGPGRLLSSLVRQHPDRTPRHMTVNLLRQADDEAADEYYLLKMIGRIWLYGGSVDWHEFYAGQRRRKLHLPTYPFERRRYWLEGDPYKIRQDRASAETRPAKRPDIADWFYVPCWKRSVISEVTGGEAEGHHRWLVLARDDPFASRFIGRLRQDGHEVTLVRPGQRFVEEEDGSYTVAAGQERDYETLLESLQASGGVPDRIVHLWSLTGEDKFSQGNGNLEQCFDLGFYSLIYLCRALSSIDPEAEVQVTVVTNQLQQVMGEKVLAPERAVLLGPVQVIPVEFPRFSCRCIDIAIPQSTKEEERWLVERLIEELRGNMTDPLVAYRGRCRLTRTFEPAPLRQSAPAASIAPRLRRGGVYLITGGLGGIGLTLARHLAEAVQCKLVLTGRSAFPGPQTWPQYLDTHGSSDRLAAKIRRLRDLEALGAEVLVFSVDVTDLEGMGRVVEHTRRRFGAINGVIHAAGLPGGGVIQLKTRRAADSVLLPKVEGALVLDRVLRDTELDFFILCSSINAVLPILGQVDYCAANAFLDVFAHYKDTVDGGCTVSVNWDAWQQVGMAAEAAQGSGAENPLKDGIMPTEGIEAFTRILAKAAGLPQVVVSTRDLSARIGALKVAAAALLAGDSEGPEFHVAGHARPDIGSKYVAPTTAAEQRLAAVWQRLLGIEQVGIDDDFFELGGDSLKALAIANVIHKETRIKISLAEFFKHPTIKRLAPYCRGVSGDRHVPIQAVEEREFYRLSASQQRMFILNQFIEYNIHYELEVEGRLDRDRFERAIGQIIHRHESLRTSFDMVMGEPVQIIRPFEAVDFKIKYFEEADEIERIIEEEVYRPFDLTEAPLLRLALVNLAGTKTGHLVLLNIHHMAADGISIGIFAREFSRFYEGEELPPLSLRYRDFCQWEQEIFQTRRFRQQEAYWLSIFPGDGQLPVLNMPTDYPRPAMQSFEGSSVLFEMAAEDVKALGALLAQAEVSLFMVLMAVYNTLLFRYTGQEDVAVGTIVAGREHPDVEALIGIFINTLAIRTYPAGSKTFKEFLHGVKGVILAAFQNQQYPFGELLEKVDLKRDLSRTPLFEVMLILQNMESPSPAVEGWQFSPYDLSARQIRQPVHAQHDITLWVVEREEGLWFNLEYCKKLFRRQTMERFAGHFLKILREIRRDTGLRLSAVELMTRQEKRQILHDFNNTQSGYPEGKTVVELFLEQVERVPHRLAVVGPGLTPLAGESLLNVTYRELHDRAGGLAALLRSRGVGADSIVAIKLERSLEMITAVVGVLIAAAAYLAVDPLYPEDRVNFMLADSGARVVVTTSGLIPISSSIVTAASFYTPKPVSPLSPAYLIYTSGSTGRPKGVMVAHGNFANAAYAWRIGYKLAEMPVHLLQLASFSFDVFAGDLARALPNGGKLVICPEDTRADFPLLYELMRRQWITLFEATPSLVIPFMDYVYENGLAIGNLRLLIVGSDRFRWEDFKRLQAHFGRQMRIINSYGVTEATIDTSYYEGDAAEVPVGGDVPIGRPMANMKFFILDTLKRPQPIGIPGELYIGGSGVARGYLNNPELTADKFVNLAAKAREGTRSSSHRTPIPKSHTLNPKSQILYRTGDLARWLGDGNVEFLGRVDCQVKIRGYRIEVKEIENRLMQHEAIREALVLDREDGDRLHRYLCAYIVPLRLKGSGENGITAAELRHHLSRALPDYMIPAQFVEIEEVPLTANGKVDERRLRAVAGDMDMGTAYVPPSNEVEETLVKMWAETLMRERIGVSDDFFALGGQSLLAMKLMARIKETFQVKVPLVSFFQVSTIKGMGKLILQARPEPVPTVGFAKKRRREREI
jgi:amino acid adenylation domain-containing protein